MTDINITKAAGKETITIAGAGPVGALLAVILGRAGYQVNLFESRPDSRLHSIYQGKSINIALSDRGWLALEAIGISEKIKANAIAMKKRVIHALDGSITEQVYLAQTLFKKSINGWLRLSKVKQRFVDT